MLRLLLGRAPGTDAEGEHLCNGHLFDGFALVNHLLCSALRTPREGEGRAGKGNSSATMRRNCASHLVHTLGILEPTVVLVQGQGVRRWLAPALGLPVQGPPYPAVETARIRGQSVDLLTFDHPSAAGRSGWWGTGTNTRYLREVVAPALRNHRETRLAEVPVTPPPV